jgi:hypothetical protein
MQDSNVAPTTMNHRTIFVLMSGLYHTLTQTPPSPPNAWIAACGELCYSQWNAPSPTGHPTSTCGGRVEWMFDNRGSQQWITDLGIGDERIQFCNYIGTDTNYVDGYGTTVADSCFKCETAYSLPRPPSLPPNPHPTPPASPSPSPPAGTPSTQAAVLSPSHPPSPQTPAHPLSPPEDDSNNQTTILLIVAASVVGLFLLVVGIAITARSMRASGKTSESKPLISARPQSGMPVLLMRN